VFIAAAAFAVKEANQILVNYTTHISLEPHHILVARPKELSRALLFTAPFTLLVTSKLKNNYIVKILLLVIIST